MTNSHVNLFVVCHIVKSPKSVTWLMKSFEKPELSDNTFIFRYIEQSSIPHALNTNNKYPINTVLLFKI